MRAVVAIVMLLLGCSSAPLDSRTGDAAAQGGASSAGTPSSKVAALLEAAPGRAKPASHTTYVLFYAGQSNMVGADWRNAPAGLPDPSVPFWLDDYYYGDGAHAFGPLAVSHHASVFAHELRTAQRLKQAGLDVAVIKLVQGATFINRWLPDFPPPSAGSKVYAELSEAVAALPARYPAGTKLVYLWTWDQGEAEARHRDLKVVESWAQSFRRIQAGFEAILGPLDPYVIRTCSTLSHKTFPGELEAQQASVVSRPSHLINTDDLEYRSDNLHRTGASQNIVGDRVADAMLQDIRQQSAH
jgi:hypothetical protein